MQSTLYCPTQRSYYGQALKDASSMTFPLTTTVFLQLILLFVFNRKMGGSAPPDDSWKGSLHVPYNVGPGFTGNFSTQLRDYFLL